MLWYTQSAVMCSARWLPRVACTCRSRQRALVHVYVYAWVFLCVCVCVCVYLPLQDVLMWMALDSCVGRYLVHRHAYFCVNEQFYLLHCVLQWHLSLCLCVSTASAALPPTGEGRVGEDPLIAKVECTVQLWLRPLLPGAVATLYTLLRIYNSSLQNTCPVSIAGKYITMYWVAEQYYPHQNKFLRIHYVLC